MHCWFFCFRSLKLLIHPFGRSGKPMVSWDVFIQVFIGILWNSRTKFICWFLFSMVKWSMETRWWLAWVGIASGTASWIPIPFLREIPTVEVRHFPGSNSSNSRRFTPTHPTWYDICHGRKRSSPALEKTSEDAGKIGFLVTFDDCRAPSFQWWLLYLLVAELGFLTV